MSLQTVLNGRPTKPLVDRILGRVKGMNEGDVLPHTDIEAMVGEARGSCRYWTVVDAAKRRSLNELGVDLESVPGVGYRKVSGFDQVKNGVGKIGRGVRAIGRGVKVVAVVSDERLPDARHRDARDHVVRQATLLRQMAQQSGRQLSSAVVNPERLPQPMLPMTGT